MQTTVAAILDRETGNYDLQWYTAFDLYWELIRPREGNFAGRREVDLVAEVAAWLNEKGY